MEAFVIIGIAWLIIAVIRGMIRAADGSHTRAARHVSARHAEPFAVRAISGHIDENDPSSPEILHVQARGVLPLERHVSLRFVTSVLDSTSTSEPKPVISTVDGFREPDSTVFQHIVDVGQYLGPGSVITEWVRVGAVIPSILVPPRRGRRRLTLCVHLVDANDPPPIRLGHCPGHPGLLHLATIITQLTFEELGYEEEAAARDDARVLAIQTAFAVAVADGHLARAERTVIESWVARVVTAYSDDAAARMKQRLSVAFEEAYVRARGGTLALGELTARLRAIAPMAQKYEAIELCLDVMGADGVAEGAELGLIRRIGEAIGIDYADIARMQDVRLPDLTLAGGTAEAALGIDPSWPPDKTRAHLRRQFATWNNRLSSLSAGDERDNAQKMLDAIAETMKKHDRDTRAGT
jgi:uncharacterized tellurite resistance protein B-like protein